MGAEGLECIEEVELREWAVNLYRCIRRCASVAHWLSCMCSIGYTKCGCTRSPSAPARSHLPWRRALGCLWKLDGYADKLMAWRDLVAGDLPALYAGTPLTRLSESWGAEGGRLGGGLEQPVQRRRMGGGRPALRLAAFAPCTGHSAHFCFHTPPPLPQPGPTCSPPGSIAASTASASSRRVRCQPTWSAHHALPPSSAATAPAPTLPAAGKGLASPAARAPCRRRSSDLQLTMRVHVPPRGGTAGAGPPPRL